MGGAGPRPSSLEIKTQNRYIERDEREKPMTQKDLLEIELIKAQTALALKQSQTEFWKIGLACLVAGAAIGGVLVQML